MASFDDQTVGSLTILGTKAGDNVTLSGLSDLTDVAGGGGGGGGGGGEVVQSGSIATSVSIASSTDVPISWTNVAPHADIPVDGTDVTFTNVGLYAITFNVSLENTTDQSGMRVLWFTFPGTDDLYLGAEIPFQLAPHTAVGDFEVLHVEATRYIPAGTVMQAHVSQDTGVSTSASIARLFITQTG